MKTDELHDSADQSALLNTGEIPPHITEAAVTLERYFRQRGIESWALMGVQSRISLPNHVDPAKALQTAREALRALVQCRDGTFATSETKWAHSMVQARAALKLLGEKS